MDHAQKAGLAMNAGFGRLPITPERLKAWSDGAMVFLEPQDFEDILVLSEAYCAAAQMFDGKPMDPPFEVEVTKAEKAKLAKVQEAVFEAAMGITR